MSQKLGRRIGVPLIVFWVACQSMLFCASLLNSIMMPLSSLDGAAISDSVKHKHHQEAGHHALNSWEPSDQFSSHQHVPSHAMDHNSANLTEDSCCDKQDSYLTNSTYGLWVPLIQSFALLLVVNLLVSTFKRFNYLRELPPNFNYPRSHLVNCTFLN